MYDRRRLTLAAGALTAAVVAWACEQPKLATPDVGSRPLFWEGCPAGTKFTGGGRIDPNGEKVTFGFNIHADGACQPIKGQLEVVHHPTQTKWHQIAIREFESYSSPEGGECGHWNGTVRAKHGNGDWHDHDFEVEVCDNGEPGSSPGTGPDTFHIIVYGEDFGYDSGRVALTGGNIQAH